MAKHKLLPTEEIYNMYQSGMLMKDIAKHFKCSTRTVAYHITKFRRKKDGNA